MVAFSQRKKRSRPDEMGDIEWLVALEEIRQLKARRDRYVDARDWDGYASLHAPDHVSHHAADSRLGTAPEPWTSVEQMMDNIKKHMPENMFSAHHSYDPEIIFETTTKARGIWAMTAATATNFLTGEAGWSIGYGYYYETYEKREEEWFFTGRRWQKHFGVQSIIGRDDIEVLLPKITLKGSDAFDEFK